MSFEIVFTRHFDSKNKVLNLAGRTEKYGPLNWPIAARVLTERYDNIRYTTTNSANSCMENKYFNLGTEMVSGISLKWIKVSRFAHFVVVVVVACCFSPAFPVTMA